MATRLNLRLSPDVVAADHAILDAVANLSDYAPVNPTYSIEAIQQLEAATLAAQQTESHLRQEADLARDQAIATLNALHSGVKGLRLQVKAQYGEDSAALHAIGLKKASERKRPTRRSHETD